MAELNLVNILYISFRLAPFILVCFFSLSSILNQDFKGLIYLAGLLMTCGIVIMFGNVMGSQTSIFESGSNAICNTITLSGSGPLSTLPLSQTVFGYTFFYLLYIILQYTLGPVNNNLVNQNIPTLVIFPLLIVTDFIWNLSNKCASFYAVLASLIIGSGCGVLWSYIIDSTGMTNLQYFNGLSNQETCSQPTAQTFKCRLYKNGQLVSNASSS